MCHHIVFAGLNLVPGMPRIGIQRNIRCRYLDYGASGVMFGPFRMYPNVFTGHVTNFAGGERSYNVSKFTTLRFVIWLRDNNFKMN